MTSHEISSTLYMIVYSENISAAASFLTNERKNQKGDFTYTVTGLIDYAFSQKKEEFLMDLFSHTDTKDILMKFGYEHALSHAIHHDNFPIFQKVVDLIDPQTLSHQYVLFHLPSVFSLMCQKGKTQMAQFLLEHDRVKQYINPFDRGNHALFLTMGNEIYGMEHASDVMRTVLLPLYQDDNQDDIEAIEKYLPKLFEKYFDVFSETKKDWIALKRLSDRPRKIWPEEMPKVDAYVSKMALRRALDQPLHTSSRKKPRAF